MEEMFDLPGVKTLIKATLGDDEPANSLDLIALNLARLASVICNEGEKSPANGCIVAITLLLGTLLELARKQEERIDELNEQVLMLSKDRGQG